MKNKLLILFTFLFCCLLGTAVENSIVIFSIFLALFLTFALYKKDSFFLYPKFYKEFNYYQLLLAGFFLLLCFLEISSEKSFSSDNLKIKFFGLLSLIFFYFFSKYIPKKILGFCAVAQLLLCGALIIFSGSKEALFALSLFTIMIAWSFQYVILCLSLLAIQSLFLLNQNSNASFLLLCSAVLASVAFIADKLRHKKYLFKDKDENHVQGKRTREFRRMFFYFATQEDRTRKERLIAGILIAGLISCIISSRVLYLLSLSNNWPVVLTWLAFFSLWASIIYLEKREKRVNVFWSYGALISIIILIWPCSLLFGLKSIGYFWLFWPSCIFFAVGTVPWRHKELFLLVVVFAVVGVKLISSYALGLAGISIFVISGITSILLSLRASRSIKEKDYLIKFPKFLNKCETTLDVIKLLALHLMGIFESSFCMYRADESPANVLFGSNIFDEIQAQWPLKIYAKEIDELSQTDSGIDIFTSKEKLEFSVKDRGSLEAQNFFGLIINCSKKIEYIFPLHIPLIPYLRSNELKIAKSLAQSASFKIEQILSEKKLSNIKNKYDEINDTREFEFSSLVHDINNTIQDLTILCDTLIDHDEIEQKNQKANKISAIARSVATVVSDAKSRREIENFEPIKSNLEINLTKVLNNLSEYAVVRAEQRGIAFLSHYNTNQKMLIRVSSQEHLETTLRNLFNNAIAYSDPGSTVEVSLKKDEDKLNLIIKDEGAGLTASEQQAIFKPGYRADSAVKRASGLGIGLAQAKSFIESIGASIKVFSAGKNQGSTFTLSFPLIETNSRSKISWALILEDQSSLLEMYEKVLHEFFNKVELSKNISEALKLLESFGPPSFVISDINLGSENGLDFVKKLRSLYGFSIPILVISGMPHNEVSTQAIAAGASDFISKPVRSAVLSSRVKLLIDDFSEKRLHD